MSERRRNLEFGALLHDVGKIAIPKEIINKPGKLDPHEWEIIKTHTVEGERMLQRVGGFMREVGQIVRSHHERWDGEGYPDRLAGPAIPLESRIISCCDPGTRCEPIVRTAGACRTRRRWPRCWPTPVSQFDPEVVKAMLRIVAGAKGPGRQSPPGRRPPGRRPARRRPARRRAPGGHPPVPAAGARRSERQVVPVADHEPVVVAVEAHHGA